MRSWCLFCRHLRIRLLNISGRMVSHLRLTEAKKLLFAAKVTLYTQHALWVLISSEFHSAPQHVVCTLVTGSVPTQNVSFTVPHSMCCAHTHSESVTTHNV